MLGEIFGEILGSVIIGFIIGVFKLVGATMLWIFFWGKKSISEIGKEQPVASGFLGFFIVGGIITLLIYFG